jgi:hypothetical protein
MTDRYWRGRASRESTEALTATPETGIVPSVAQAAGTRQEGPGAVASIAEDKQHVKVDRLTRCLSTSYRLALFPAKLFLHPPIAPAVTTLRPLPERLLSASF